MNNYWRLFVKRHSSKHHVLPRSRCQKRVDKNNDNIVILPDYFHNAWHTLVGNMTTEEAIIFFRLVMMPNISWNNKSLAKLRDEIKKGRYAREG